MITSKFLNPLNINCKMGMIISSVQLLSLVRLFSTPWTVADQASLSITNSQTHVHWVSDAIQPSHPLSSPSPPALNLFQHQGLFQRAPKHSNMLAICYRTLFLPCVSLRLPQWSGRKVRLWTFCGRANTTWHWCCPYFGLCCLPLSRLLWIPHKH